MIIDGFTFFNEYDILSMRLEELYPVVDRFVLVQADKTFRGDPKAHHFRVTDEQWEPWADKIMSVDITVPDLPGPWEREEYQRNVIGDVMKNLSYYEPDNICIVSDVDEIPRRDVVSVLPLRVDDLHRFPASLDMRMYYYALNVRAGGWGGAKVCLADDLNTAQELRHSDVWSIPDSGWHFSYLGDDEFISNKFKAFSHAELDVPKVHGKIAENRANLLDPFNHGEQLHVEEIDDTWPEAVKNNREYWEKYVWTK